jgi:hypothetical protein
MLQAYNAATPAKHFYRKCENSAFVTAEISGSATDVAGALMRR